MDSLRLSVSRFTYVPDERYDTVDAAFAAKPLAEWTNVTPKHSPSFTLTVDKTPQNVIMKCLDGTDVAGSWDLSAMRREVADDPSRRIVIVKFPYIVFRWYTHHEQILRRIQFKLSNRSEFTSLTNFCIGHFGAIRDLHDSMNSTSTVDSSPRPPSTPYFNYAAATQQSSSPPPATPSTGARRTGGGGKVSWVPPPSSQRWSPVVPPPSSQRRPTSSAWVPKSSQSLRSVTRMLDDVDRASQVRTTASSVVPEPAVKLVSEPVKPVVVSEPTSVEKPFEITETIILSLLEDESFMAEVVAVSRLWDKLGLNRRLFSVDL